MGARYSCRKAARAIADNSSKLFKLTLAACMSPPGDRSRFFNLTNQRRRCAPVNLYRYGMMFAVVLCLLYACSPQVTPARKGLAFAQGLSIFENMGRASWPSRSFDP